MATKTVLRTENRCTFCSAVPVHCRYARDDRGAGQGLTRPPRRQKSFGFLGSGRSGCRRQEISRQRAKPHPVLPRLFFWIETQHNKGRRTDPLTDELLQLDA